MRIGLKLPLATAGLLAASAALAQVLSPAASIQARQASFRETGTALKAINEELRKDAPGRFAMASSARQIAANLRQAASLFPAGSGPAPGVKTRAQAAIWSNRATFDRANGAAVRQADALVPRCASPILPQSAPRHRRWVGPARNATTSSALPNSAAGEQFELRPIWRFTQRKVRDAAAR